MRFDFVQLGLICGLIGGGCSTPDGTAAADIAQDVVTAKDGSELASEASQTAISPGSNPVQPQCLCYKAKNCPDIQIGNVAFLPAVPPGDWAHQANTGIAAALIVIAHLNGEKPNAQMISDAQLLLQKQSAGGWDPHDGNGDPAGVSSLQLVALAKAAELGASPRQLPTCEAVAEDMAANRPLLVLVAAQTANPYPSQAFKPGLPQFMVLIGIDSDFAYVLDPAQPLPVDACGPACNGRKYDLWQFATAWAQNGNLAVRIAYPMK